MNDQTKHHPLRTNAPQILPWTRGLLLQGLHLQRWRAQGITPDYQPYAKQRDFHQTFSRERLLMAGNQLGKTTALGHELAMHLTGRYPRWWRGQRFTRPIRAWASSVTAMSTRDNPQRVLLGQITPQGLIGGAIHKDLISKIVRNALVTGGLDHAFIAYRNGGHSMLGFRSYAQGRERWQGPSLDAVWFDEEPPWDIYVEGLTRTNATGGFVMLSFTPLKGYSEVVSHFLAQNQTNTPAQAQAELAPATKAVRTVTQIGLYDAEHLSAEQKQAIIASYAPHELGPRVRGEPAVGEGRIFPFGREQISCEPFTPPAHWARIAGLDFGWDHPTAAVLLVHDRDRDILYVTQSYSARQKTPAEHCAVLRTWGSDLPWMWPHDGLQTEKGSGLALARQFREQGLGMHHEPVRFVDGSQSVEAGILEMYARMQSGKLKVFSNAQDWFNEFALYHRKNGRIVKLRDDLLSATRYAMMGLRFARPLVRTQRQTGVQQANKDYNPLSW